VPITDNKLVLVGENGAGKSTVANFIYFFLTRQWNRILEYDFNSISAVLDWKEITIRRDDIDPRSDELIGSREDLEAFRSVMGVRIPARTIRDIELILGRYSYEGLARIYRNRNELMNISRDTGVPPNILTEYVSRMIHQQFPLSEKLKEIDQILMDSVNYQVLYLPTYRRIEQELRSIFPGLDVDFRRLQEQLSQRSGKNSYIELVQFGMEDVERAIDNKMNNIKESVRNDLNKLTGTYLRDVIRGDYRSADLLPKLKELDEQNINDIFSRIPTAILSDQEQRRLRDIITEVKDKNIISDSEIVVAHFLVQLIELHNVQQENERDIREFVRVCNIYLSGKEIVYDNSKFEIAIVQHNSRESSQVITMRMLSSGEKQIVSLLSHIYLAGASGYFVIIDEPELSLSVPWQKRFLPDILGTDRCRGLIAVTHSPFVFENELDKYTHSLEEFVEPANVVSR
jgi:predicted ATP-binding protein involved in virulence